MTKKFKTIHIIAVIIILVIVGGSFFGGMLYGKSQNSRSFAGNGTFQTRINRAGTGGNFISGSIISKDATSITLQLPNNTGSKIIFYSDTTQIAKSATGTANDLATGTSVSVTGTTNSDGSVTAQSIQIRPAGGQNFQPGVK
ncbi:MAG: DUF5666 domain-containing protein [Candidatus Staskawiczbacteria bacterium]|nr:DUF5666 domain-containing protein [Candidatus Staskawiczbacteria bacterium]